MVNKTLIFRLQREALCHNTTSNPQKTELFAAFVPLQRNTLFLWKTPVAKAAKAKLRVTLLLSSKPGNKGIIRDEGVAENRPVK